jgi:hypothetical protein
MAGIGSKWRAVLLDLLERSGWSAGQVFFATLLAGGTTVAVTGLPWKYASTLAISAALSSLVLTVLQYLVRWTDLKFWPDTLARLAKTFLASVAASVAADKVFDITKFDWGTAFDVAFLATVSSLGKGLLAREQAQPASPRAATDGAVTAVAADLRTTPSTLPTQTYVEAVKR